MRYESTTAAMLTVMRRHLRHEGFTAARLARELSVSEATAKRWIAGRGLTLDRLERLANLCGVSIAEVAREAESDRSGLTHELTLAQERALSADIVLSLTFMAILAGASVRELSEDFAIPRPVVDNALARLERLALIDRLRGERLRPLVDRALAFRKLPMRALFQRYMKQHFMTMDFSAPEAVYASEIFKLSQVGQARLAELIEQFRRDAQTLSEHDRNDALLARQWVAMLCAVRPLPAGGLREADQAS